MTQVTQVRVTQDPKCFIPSANPRLNSCLRCGKLSCRPNPDQPVTEPQTRPRDIPLERELTQLAAQAAGHADDHGLRDYADARSLPGGVRVGIDWDEEAGAEFGDAANYLVWGIIEVYEAAMAGDPVALDQYERRMRALSGLVGVWRDLLTDAA